MDREWLELEIKLAKKARIKTLEDFKEKLIKSWTHGDAFRFIHEPTKYEESRRKAEDMVNTLISNNKEIIPFK